MNNALDAQAPLEHSFTHRFLDLDLNFLPKAIDLSVSNTLDLPKKRSEDPWLDMVTEMFYPMSKPNRARKTQLRGRTKGKNLR